MVRIVLVKPGATDFDEQRRIMGILDIPLNSKGTAEVAQAASELAGLSIDYVYTSPCQSAVQTAKTIASRLQVKFKQVEQLANLNHGLWQGKQIDEVKSRQPKIYRRWQEDPESVCPPEGEMLSAVRERIRSALDKLLKKHKSGAVAIVAPEPLVSVVRSELKQVELGDLWKAGCTSGSWEVIDVEPRNMVTH